jgi:hypothetical protein
VMKDTAEKTSGASSADFILDTRLAYETRLVLSRNPTARELAVLRNFYKEALAMPIRPVVVRASMNSVPARELDAFTAVGGVLFNLDAALVR